MTFSSVNCSSSYSSNHPLINSNPQSKDKIENVIELVKNFALNPIEELYGRVFWTERYPKSALSNYSIKTKKDVYFFETANYITFEGLMAALVGPTFKNESKSSVNCLRLNGMDQNWNPLVEQIKKNEEQLISMSLNEGFVYGLSLEQSVLKELITKDCSYHSHHLVIIQYLDENEEIKYQFFQSLTEKYSLKDYLDRYQSKYTQDNFWKFIEELKHFVSEQMDENFLKNYFYAEYMSEFDNQFPQHMSLEVKWIPINTKKIESLRVNYNVIRQSENFPKSFKNFS